MMSRLSRACAIFATLLLASCASSDLAILPKSAVAGGGQASGSKGFRLPFVQCETFPTAKPSAETLAAAATKQQDRHGMPVYKYSDRKRVVRTTAYTHTEADHLAYSNKNATGTPLQYGQRVRSAAADWSFYPVGTVFRISGLPYLYVIDDYGSALTVSGTIDIYKPSKALMKEWGRREVEIHVVRWGSFERSAEILATRTRYDHCRRMLANIVRQMPETARFVKN
ncbi:MAG: 3D domain-containing protein [Akkermansiaceae bacterium]|jgi:3D (Asp-Asp-Asp) domain-containing protein|nr:3D domain-containing protein [Akkermansiaceae bacterium]